MDRTKEAVLELLCKNQREYLSGEALACQLKISRTAVWKSIQILKAEGYRIKAAPHRGYQLQSVPDLLLPAEITRGLHTKIIGREIHYFPEIDSTNVRAKALAKTGVPDGTIVIAETQTAGRGRRGRSWESPPGLGLWMTVVLRPQVPLQQTASFTLLAALAVVRVIKSVCDLSPRIKWPNDVLIGGRKVCGILAEASGELEMLEYLLVGIGLNVNQDEVHFAPEVRSKATSLRLARHQMVDRLVMARALLEELDSLYFKQPDFAELVDLIRPHSATLGARVRVEFTGGGSPGVAAVDGATAGDYLTGRAVEILPDGGLLIEDDAGRQLVIHAGDVSIRGEDGNYS
ncbi:MAG: biotin--[acetyl-CoA-carboxylase] ligase [Syntrophothermus sp.]